MGIFPERILSTLFCHRSLPLSMASTTSSFFPWELIARAHVYTHVHSFPFGSSHHFYFLSWPNIHHRENHLKQDTTGIPPIQFPYLRICYFVPSALGGTFSAPKENIEVEVTKWIPTQGQAQESSVGTFQGCSDPQPSCRKHCGGWQPVFSKTVTPLRKLHTGQVSVTLISWKPWKQP